MRLRKGLLALPIVLLAMAAGCLPQPDEPVEFLTRPDSVIIQLKRVDAPESPFAQRVAVPDFTLYGDGTVIFSRDGGSTLVQARVPEDAIRDLLEFMEDEDFFDFRYEAPGAAGASGPTAYLYAQAKREANATSAGLAGDEGDDVPEQVRRLQKIIERLEGVDPVELGGSEQRSYAPDAYLLVVEAESAAGDAPAWPFPEIDVDDVLPAGSEIGELVVEGDAALALADTLVPGEEGVAVFRAGDRSFRVGFRPLLPFEEHFPEFELP